MSLPVEKGVERRADINVTRLVRLQPLAADPADAENGDILWQSRLTTSTQGFPISYMVDGRQYIAIPVGLGGASWSSMLPNDLAPELRRPRSGSAIHVFALPEQSL